MGSALIKTQLPNDLGTIHRHRTHPERMVWTNINRRRVELRKNAEGRWYAVAWRMGKGGFVSVKNVPDEVIAVAALLRG